MRMTQCEVVNKLLGRGFARGRKHDGDTVYMAKRSDWMGRQVLALVRPDGSVNGGTAEQFLETV